jgi:hypothetical protein
MRRFVVIAIIGLWSVSTVSAAILYVDDSATGANNGTSWQDAYLYLPDALAEALSGDEIRVAQGVYRPDQSAYLDGLIEGDRDVSFQLKNGVILRGRYAGCGTPDPDQRAIERCATILTGDLAGNDIEVADAADLLAEPTRDENSRNVVTATDCDNTAVIDGFTITGGNANGPAEAQKYGGGICSGMPTISNCTIIGNSADIGGGGIYLYYDAQGLITDCIVAHNAAPTGGGIYGCTVLSNCVINANAATMYSGGGVYLGQGCDTTVTDCTFSNNSAVTYGGGVMLGVSGSTPIFTRCVFIANSVDGSGGAVASDGCTCGAYPEFHQCTFAANTANASGGAVYSFGYSLPTLLSCLLTGNHSGTNGGAFSHGWGAGSYIANCTIAHNTAADTAGGIFYDDSYSWQLKMVANCIIWGNSGEASQKLQDQQIFALGPSNIPSVSYSCIEGWSGMGGTGSVGDTAQNPKFIDADGPDDLPGNEDDNLRLQQDSPCINHGTNEHVPTGSEDLDGNSRVLNGLVDMGAYEYCCASAATIYVDDSAVGANNGSSWVNAFRYLQDALALATEGAEIRVAQGTYSPDCGQGSTPGDRYNTFHLISGVTIRGGYAGDGAPEPDTRDPIQYKAILTGDLVGDDYPVDSLEEWEDNESRSDNSYHVVTAMHTDSTAVLDGFTVSGGYADATSPRFYGAGMYIYQGSPTVANCVFTDNWALNYGAGMCIDSNSTPIIIDCVFTANASTDGAGVDNEDSNPTFICCTFTGNIAYEFNADSYGGAGMYNYRSNPTLTNCIFTGNVAPGWGTCGALQNNQSSPTLLNCTFHGNHAEGLVGAVYNGYESFPKLTNCILWGNTNEEANDQSAQIAGEPGTVNYCCIQGWRGDLGGLGNINADPCFVRPGYWKGHDSWVDGDYHLKSFGWRWDTVHEEWTFDRVTSRCIDAGCPGSSLLNEPLTVPSDPDNDYGQNLRINMGAYGGTDQASMPPYDWALLADIDNDGIVDSYDFVYAGQDWQLARPQQPSDLDRSGNVGLLDLDLLADDWLKITLWWE